MKRSIIPFFVNMYMLTCLPQLCLTFCNPTDCSPPGVGFLWQEYWSGLPFLSSGDFPDPGIKTTSLMSPALQVDSLLSESPGKPCDNV